MSPPHPIVSTGTSAGVDLRAEAIFPVTVTRRGKRITVTLSPDQIVGDQQGRVSGLWRELTAKYLVLRDGNRCAIRSQYCTQGDAPFENAAGADFDHIRISRPPDRRLANLRLACHPCNAHWQRVQWKLNRAASSSGKERERGGQALTYGPQVDLNVQLFPAFQDWLDTNCKRTHGVPLEDAIYKSARQIREEYGHGSWQTMYGYLKTLTTGDDAPYYVDAKKKIVYRRSRVV